MLFDVQYRRLHSSFSSTSICTCYGPHLLISLNLVTWFNPEREFSFSRRGISRNSLFIDRSFVAQLGSIELYNNPHTKLTINGSTLHWKRSLQWSYYKLYNSSRTSNCRIIQWKYRKIRYRKWTKNTTNGEWISLKYRINWSNKDLIDVRRMELSINERISFREIPQQMYAYIKEFYHSFNKPFHRILWCNLINNFPIDI